MVLLNCEDQVWMKRVDIEVSISKLLGSVHDWLNIIDRFQAEDSVRIKV
jgi:hypothetical protein